MKIINFGSANLDLVYSVEHLVKPGETVSCRHYEQFVGGKGLNQSIAAARAGTNVMHVGKVGRDDKILRETLKKCGVDTGMLEESDEDSGHAVIQVDRNGQNSIIVYGGANCDVDEQLVDKALDMASEEDIVLLQNEITCTAYIMRQAYAKGLRVAFNPSPATENIKGLPLECVKWFLLNEVEGGSITGCSAPREIAKRMVELYPHCTVVLTLGRNGVLYYDGNQMLSQEIFRVPCVDTTGAGDTFVGYFLSAVLSGKDIPQCLRLASAASALSVSRNGASPSIPVIGEVLSAKFA